MLGKLLGWIKAALFGDRCGNLWGGDFLRRFGLLNHCNGRFNVLIIITCLIACWSYWLSIFKDKLHTGKPVRYADVPFL